METSRKSAMDFAHMMLIVGATGLLAIWCFDSTQTTPHLVVGTYSFSVIYALPGIFVFVAAGLYAVAGIEYVAMRLYRWVKT